MLTRSNEYQNFKVDPLRVQNNQKLKSSTVEFFSDKLLSAPTKSNPGPLDLKLDDLPLEQGEECFWAQKFRYFKYLYFALIYLSFLAQKLYSSWSGVERMSSNPKVLGLNLGWGRQKFI